MDKTRTLVRFGLFEFDAESGELRKQGRKIRLPDQPTQILALLLEHPGEVVSRDAVRQRLWPADTFVDFDAGLNSATKKLRDALGDPAENPRFVETLPRRGYRFIAPVTDTPAAQPEVRAVVQETAPAPRFRYAWISSVVAFAVTVAVLLVAAAWQNRVATSPTSAEKSTVVVSAEARDAHMKGTVAMGRQTPEGFRSAVAYFEQAIAREPEFAQAHAALAQAQMQLLFTGPLAPRDVVPKAEAAARRALQLDDTLAQAHTTLGSILTNFHWKWAEGEREFQRARALADQSSDTRVGGAGIESLIRAGRVQEAIVESEAASNRDPRSFNAHVNAASAYRAAGEHDRAVERYRQALEIDPQSTRGHFQLGITLVRMGQLDEGILELEAATTRSRSNPRFQAYLAYAYAVAGRRDDARAILKALDARARKEYVSSFGIALIYDALGEREPALAAVERAYEDRAVEFAQMAQYPIFKTIAAEPRYRAVMQSIGLKPKEPAPQ
jgi:DNA-binding winged helix-turn-helix (wHTH) protein/tetratricopeptide (TPR) repeat protein